MLEDSYRYYEKIYGELPKFNLGLNILFFPVTILYFLSALSFGPLLYFIENIIFGERLKNEIIEFVFGISHLRVSNKLLISNSGKYYFNLNKKQIEITKNSYVCSRFRLFIISLLKSWKVFKALSYSAKNSILRNNSLRIIKMVALEEFAKFHFKNKSVYIQYNDHIPYFVNLESVAKQSGLKSVYIQHAPISNLFPGLYHDLNVLFSEDSMQKYFKIDKEAYKSKGVFCLFDVRFPEINHIKNKKINALVCYNLLDSMKEIRKLVNTLIDNGYSVVLRPHPSDKRKVRGFENIEISVGRTIWEDLKYAAFVIVNESAVTLESLYLNIPTYKLSSLSLSLRDNYGFINKGLITKEYFNENELIKDIGSAKIVWDANKLEWFIGNVKNRKLKLKLLNEKIKTLI